MRLLRQLRFRFAELAFPRRSCPCALKCLRTKYLVFKRLVRSAIVGLTSAFIIGTLSPRLAVGLLNLQPNFAGPGEVRGDETDETTSREDPTSVSVLKRGSTRYNPMTKSSTALRTTDSTLSRRTALSSSSSSTPKVSDRLRHCEFLRDCSLRATTRGVRTGIMT